MGVTYKSVGNSRIEVTTSPDGVSIVANRDGLRSMILLLEDLLAVAGRDHVHLTPTMQLPDGSEPLLIATSDDVPVPDAFPSDWANMSMEQRRIWRLEAQLLRWEQVALAEPDGEHREP